MDNLNYCDDVHQYYRRSRRKLTSAVVQNNAAGFYPSQQFPGWEEAYVASYYSQNGEDYLLDELVDHKSQGYFVEVGSLDGRHFSNTLHFEEKGWKGICIEAHPDYIDLLRSNRPGSVICDCAAGREELDDVIFFTNRRGSLSTLDRHKEDQFRQEYGNFFSGFEPVHVRQRTLSSLFREHGVTEVDILSIDVEGTEMDVLSGLDLSVWAPGVIVLEFDGRKDRQRQQRSLRRDGYRLCATLANNAFYSRAPHPGARAYDARIELVHTAHPLDGGSDITLSTSINAIEPMCILSRLRRSFVRGVSRDR